MTRFSSLAIVALVLGHATPLFALAPGARVDNFRLLDHRGESRELYYLSDAKAIVLMVYGNGCPIVRNTLPALRALRDQYRPHGVEFLLIDSNPQDSLEEIAAEADELGIDLPILIDESQLIGESLGIVRTADVLLIEPKTWKLRYRGPLDDRVGYGTQRPAATKNYLADALEATLAGKPLARAQVEALGCLIPFKRSERISYSEQIAPLLLAKCSACHRSGGGAPWAMSSHKKIAGFAPMIREVVRTARMPPWHADPHYGSFVGDRALSIAETRMLVHWIEAGAPRGAGPDPLLALPPARSEWTLGKPDVIVEVPAYDVPATGVINYQYPRVDNPIGRDAWIRAVEVLPSHPAIVHHVLVGIDDPSNAAQRNIRGQIGELGGYAPGKNTLAYPEDTGILLRKQAGFRFQMHYTPNGKATRVTTRIGVYLRSTPPKHTLKLSLIYDTSLAIPAHSKSHRAQLEHTFDRDVLLYSLMPHAHLRGRSAKFTAHYPDGRREVLLSVPQFDFNWQTTYALSPPKPLPTGTRIALDMSWDNSAQNPANPDATRAVYWGEQTWEEMNVGWIRYRDRNESLGQLDPIRLQHP